MSMRIATPACGPWRVLWSRERGGVLEHFPDDLRQE
jgi:hypothetical protein